MALGAAAVAVPSDLAPRSVNPSLVLDFGITPGQGRSGGDCAGYKGARIPCDCPPNRNTFISKLNENVAAGNLRGIPVPWPTDSSVHSAQIRLNSMILTLQNIKGPGFGCPVVSTVWQLDQALYTILEWGGRQ
jgi:hypothetical protein